MRERVIIGLTLGLLLVPLAVGYLTVPCDTFGEPLVLSPHRLRQQRYLSDARTWQAEVAEISATLDAIAYGPEPGSLGKAFLLAEQVGQAVGRLDALTPPEAPVEYGLLAATLDAARDTLTYAAERLLAYYGSHDPQALGEAREALRLADLALADVCAGIDALTYSLCREVWRAQ